MGKEKLLVKALALAHNDPPLRQDNTPMRLRWIIEQRLEFIEFRLFWEGRINRTDLVKEFGISIPQASADLQRYAAFAESNLTYDASAKAYIAPPNFEPYLLKPSARRYLSYLRGLADEVFQAGETWLGWVPEFSTVPFVRRKLDANLLRRVVQAIRAKQSLHIHYQSMSRPEPLWRWIEPHALGFDGFRWHARAWCHERKDFVDFVLARMREISDETRRSEADSTRDLAWHQYVTLKIAPNPALPKEVQNVIELEFGMESGALALESRICLSFYLMRHLRLDLDPAFFTPQQQHLVLLNRAEIEAAQQQAKRTHAMAGNG